jgi:hypothetical protein
MRVQVCHHLVGAPDMYVSLLHGNREISDTTRRRWRVASGRLIVKADDVRYGEVRPTHTTGEAGEQSGETCGGVRGGKVWEQEECGTAKQGTDAESTSRVPGAGPHT